MDMDKEEFHKKCAEMLHLLDTHSCWVCKEKISRDDLCFYTGTKYYHLDCGIINGLLNDSKREFVYKAYCYHCGHETTHLVLKETNREMIACCLCGQQKKWDKRIF